MIQGVIAGSDFQEADYLAQEIDRLRRLKSYAYRDIAILYRQNSMSRLIEKRFLEQGIPYRMVRGVSFYERMEVKDVLAILRLTLNPSDVLSMERVSKVKGMFEGFGAKTLGRWNDWLAYQPEGLMSNPVQFWSSVESGAWNIKGKAGPSMKKFAEHMLSLNALADEGIGLAVDYVLHDMGYDGYLRAYHSDTYNDRSGNVLELKSIIPDGNLGEALAEAALYTDADTARTDRDAVGLMTLHAAKGLEFPVVFIVGLEEYVFPHYIKEDCEDPDAELEEERRLCYVGMTRAEEKLYMTCARSRMLYGQPMHNDQSRFLMEIPEQFIDIDERGMYRFGSYDKDRGRRYGGYGNNRGYRLW